MPGYFNPSLPAFRVPGPIDFSPLNNALDDIGRAQEKNRLLRQSQEIGSAIGSGDYKAGAQKAFGYGNLDTGVQLMNMQRQTEQDAYNRSRQAAVDRRAIAAESRAAGKYASEIEDRFNTRMGTIANTIRSASPELQGAMWKRVIGSHPKMAEALTRYGIDPNNVDAGTNFFISQARGLPDKSSAEYGTTAQKYIGPDGKVHIYQLSKTGGRKDIEFPEGATPLDPLQFVDTGTGTAPYSRLTGNPAAPVIPKNVAEAAAQSEQGKSQGQARQALPAARTSIGNALATIDTIRKHPGLSAGTGASNVFDPRNWVPGTNAYDFQVLNQQAQSQSFMIAREALKGAGQVTDFEGAKGEQAIANLNAAQSKEQYLKALDNLERMMRASYADLQRKAGQTPQPDTTGQSTDLNALKQKYGLE